MSARWSPSATRSRAAKAFTAWAAEGRLRLQQCQTCGHICYPAREGCPCCWSAALEWSDVPPGGVLLTESTLHRSFDPFFKARLPWRIGTVHLDAGPSVLAHVHGAVPERARVRVIARTDGSAQGVLMALPEHDDPNIMDDRQMRILTCDPHGRSVLVTDVGNATGQAVAEAMVRAGAAVVLGGDVRSGGVGGAVAPGPADGIEPVSLDLADEHSVASLAEEVGDRLDIVVHTSSLVRPGATLRGWDVEAAQQEMEANYFSLLRLARTLGPVMRDHTGRDGDALRAWVNLLSVYALSGGLGYGTSAASQAAGLSLSQELRAEMAGHGVKVIEILCGPPDDVWNAGQPAPKISASWVASAVVSALQQGIERMAVGPVAEDIIQRFQEGPMALEREGTQP